MWSISIVILDLASKFYVKNFIIKTSSKTIATLVDRQKHVLTIEKNDPGRTWTCNLRCRKPTPYPLGHRANDKKLCQQWLDLE